jgi:CRP/FNR family transcriptional regulator, cyclic AMP receptor protein
MKEEELWLEDHGQTLHRSGGHVFMEQGEWTDFVLLIRKGHVKVLVGTPKRFIAVRHAGEIVGEMSAIRKKPRSATIQAIADVEMLRVSASQWRKFLQSHPRAALAQIAAADKRLDEATQKIAESELAVEQRLAKALIELLSSGLAEDTEDGLRLRVSQQDLAALAGASLDSVKKIIRTFKSSGIVGTAKLATIILDSTAIQEIADGDRTAST